MLNISTLSRYDVTSGGLVFSLTFQVFSQLFSHTAVSSLQISQTLFLRHFSISLQLIFCIPFARATSYGFIFSGVSVSDQNVEFSIMLLDCNH